ncbi:ATP-binding cassette domain-containing protein [Chlorobium sp.]|uniref:ABC transporter ATP-binding protein n=1 Tax=Chlorobium sp. TaxID=1095 RepID=UPI0025BC79EB|nr:ATP-binding cassette domain-containing protein [Chlorobium sp.]
MELSAFTGSAGTLLDIRNIKAFRGATQVFDAFSLQIDEGCSTAILGPNGSGKSTLMKLISGELHPCFSPDSSLSLFGRNRWNVWDLRSRLGIVSHDLQHEYLASAPGLNVVLSGFYSSIDTWRNQVFGDREYRKADEVMAMLGIGDLRSRAFGSLSTGEQRRFLLARALVNDPGTLLFDEPTSGLDLKASFLYLELLRKLMRSGKTVLLVTHHVHEIPPEIRRIVMLREGRVLADGSPGEMLSSAMLSALFDCPLQVVMQSGSCQVFPAFQDGPDISL